MSDKNDLIFEDNKWDKSNKEYFNYIKKLDFYFSKKFQCKNILGGGGEKVRMEYHMKFFLILEHILEQQIFLAYYIVMKFIKKF